MEIILYLLLVFLKFYLILGVIFTLLLGIMAYVTKTENEYTVLEIFYTIFIYPIIIYYFINPSNNE
jgi:hypothetical protein